MKWKDVWFGALLTAALFGAGKYLIGFAVGSSDAADLYDAAGSMGSRMVAVPVKLIESNDKNQIVLPGGTRDELKALAEFRYMK